MDQLGSSGAGPRPHFSSPLVDKVARRMRRVFAGLDGRPYLLESERREFRCYLSRFEEALARIDGKIASGRLHPLDLGGFPQVLHYPGYAARVGVFIGSFDPFQMTHLATALGFLSSEASDSDLVFVIPEGAENPNKPHKTEYAFRYELLRLQVEGVFSPFVVPLDLGAGADTIAIVERLIDLHPGARLELTHVLGSDSLPMAARFLEADLEAWRRRAALRRVDLVHRLHVALRSPSDPLEPYRSQVLAQGSGFALDDRIAESPSSTDFRESRNLTIVFPTQAVLSRMELLFRYGMNRGWMSAPAQASGDFEI